MPPGASYLQQAYRLGREFESDLAPARTYEQASALTGSESVLVGKEA